MLRHSSLISLFFGIVLIANQTICFAFETDQYNLPPVPLADIGDEVTDHSFQTLREIVTKTNAEIADLRNCINGSQTDAKGCGGKDTDQKRLDYLLSRDAIAHELYRTLGSGNFPFTRIGKWMNSHEFRGQPSRYKTSYSRSLFILLPTNYLTISPTVNMYGSQFGVDKIEHFFQQGYTYYKIYTDAIAKGSSSEVAIQKAIKWGKLSERTFFGSLVSGVYSNADLYANYVGMRFYQSLFESVKMGETTRLPLLSLKNNIWVFREQLEPEQEFIRPFISDHLNEALNPSIFSFNLRPTVRRVVKNHACQQWSKAYPEMTKESLDAKSSSLKLWYGEDYGFTPSRKFITIADRCFAKK